MQSRWVGFGQVSGEQSEGIKKIGRNTKAASVSEQGQQIPGGAGRMGRKPATRVNLEILVSQRETLRGLGTILRNHCYPQQHSLRLQCIAGITTWVWSWA